MSMGCKWYLATTAAEMSAQPPAHPIAWMACHFSSAGSGLSNLPPMLPEDSLVIVDDSTPFTDHDPQRIAAQLAGLGTLSGVLLDLQREAEGIEALLHCLTETLSCPVAVTEAYGHKADCAVFLSAPLNMPLENAIAPWKNRQIWLDIPFGVQTFTVTEKGCRISGICPTEETSLPHWDQNLHCKYGVQVQADRICFTLQRTSDALDAILQEASNLQIPIAISLLQEYGFAIDESGEKES